MQHDLVTTGILSAMPAALLVQLLKLLFARHVEPRWGRAKWNATLRVLSAIVGTLAGFLIRGDIAGAAAGMGGGLACTAILAAIFRISKTWLPTGPAAPPADVPFDPGDEP